MLLLVPLIALMACHKKKDLTPFRWMSGKWKGEALGDTLNRQGTPIIYEEWSAVQNNRMTGTSCELQNGDTVFSQTMTLEQRGDDFYYVANVKENGGPVDFKFTGTHRDSMIFENPAHDFPQRIVYFHDADKGMYARIDGKDKGKYSYMEFRYHRTQTAE